MLQFIDTVAPVSQEFSRHLPMISQTSICFAASGSLASKRPEVKETFYCGEPPSAEEGAGFSGFQPPEKRHLQKRLESNSSLLEEDVSLLSFGYCHIDIECCCDDARVQSVKNSLEVATLQLMWFVKDVTFHCTIEIRW